MKRRNPARADQYKSPRYTEIVDRIAVNLRALREARGWTQDECAFQCGDMGPAMLRTIEAGRTNVTSTTLARLCDGLDVDVTALLQPAAPLVRRKSGRPKKIISPEALPPTTE